jgi:3-hydroxyacyl-CoA dehydrogenase/enoyl-CoA hydratase/3-hydroxybutyryl-CoA epimerase
VDIFEKVYKQGFLGKKSNKGFYLYGKKRILNPEIQKILGTKIIAKRNSEEWLKRMLYVMINEAAKCLEEGIIDSSDAVDLGMIMGTGFPPFRGGLLHYAQTIGIEKIIQELQGFETQFQSDRFKPSPYLRQFKANATV